MKIMYTVDPDDNTLEFMAGNDNFWKMIQKENNPFALDMHLLDDVITELLFNLNDKYSGKYTNAYYGDVIDENGNKMVLRNQTVNILSELEPETQQSVLADISDAFVGAPENIISNLKTNR